ncbi:MAG: ATP-grasp ribosomal peptide maturase [Actinomycetota bacterium]|nr:ATP-grasp ribosomal peptide maturase [Actinomycetota bacterium]
MTVVVLAQDCDAPVDRVVLALAERSVPVFRADLAWFPQHLAVDAELVDGRWVGVLRSEHRSVDLGDIRSIWYRDPAAFHFPPAMTAAERSFAFAEARLGVGGVLATLDALWVNFPNRACDAMYKPVQLATAARCGLDVARTLVTNDAAAVRRFAEASPHGLVHKTFGANTLTESGTLKVAFTRRLAMADLAEVDGVAHTAHQFQDWLAGKAYEVRVIAVGGQLFPVAIHATSPAARLDWRSDYDALSYELIELPSDVDNGVRRYLAALRLTYAAFDFVVDREGCYTFLESNSSGQFGWLEANTGAPITDALADLLARGAP